MSPLPGLLVAIRNDMFRFAMLQVRNDTVAEDLVQDAIEAALRHQSTFEGRSALKSWVFAILRNRIIDHGQRLEGQPNWRSRLPTGRLPAPPHDATGHTWHHPDVVLFSITKEGVEAHALPGYQSDMPAFNNLLSDFDIWAVLSYIKSQWPTEVQQKHTLMNQASRRQN